MTPDPNRFTVELAGLAHSDLERLAVWAERRALRPLLAEVFRLLVENLETQPRDWGDPYHNYRDLNAVGYGKTITPGGLRVEYAVHDTRPHVWLTRVRPLSGSPFSGS